jgi:uncharacterized protein
MQNITKLQPINRLTNEYRTRTAYCLISEEGKVLFYDSERTFVLKPPEYIQNLIKKGALLTNTSIELNSWLKANDLVTKSYKTKHGAEHSSTLPAVTDVSIDLSGNCNMACKYCFEKPIFSRTGNMTNKVIKKTLEFAFEKCEGSSTLSLHFGSGEPLIEFNKLKQLVSLACQIADHKGINLGFELTTNGTLINKEIAAYLAEHSFNVRLSCDGPPHVHNTFRKFKNGRTSYDRVERGLNELLSVMSDRITINTVICSGTRLRAIWDWAKSIGIKHIHTVKVGSKKDSGLVMGSPEIAAYKSDLIYICNDIIHILSQGQTPLEFQPITKIIRRLMIPAPINRFCGVSGSYLGIASDGKVYPCFRHLGVEKYCFGDIEKGISDKLRKKYRNYEASPVDERPTCSYCWAKYLCGGGCYADPVIYGDKNNIPLLEQCNFWKTDIATAISFYDELRTIDPTYCLRLFGDDIDDIIGRCSNDQPEFVQNRKTL